MAQEGKHNDYVIKFVGLMADVGYDMQYFQVCTLHTAELYPVKLC